MQVKANEEITSLPLREQQLLQAMHEPQIIAEIPYEFFQTDEWIIKLISWCSILGITQVPDPAEAAFVVDALVNDYKNHTFAEIEVALKMCVHDEFPETIEAYNKFNLKFLAKLMKAFRKYRMNVGNKYDEIRFKLHKPEPHIPTPFELDIDIANQMWDDYLRLINDVPFYPMSYKADLLLELGILTQDDITPVQEEVKTMLLFKNPDFMRKEDRARHESLIQDQERLNIHVENTAKNKCYKNWLNLLHEQHTTFEKFCDILEAPIFKAHDQIKIVIDPNPNLL